MEKEESTVNRKIPRIVLERFFVDVFPYILDPFERISAAQYFFCNDRGMDYYEVFEEEFKKFLLDVSKNWSLTFRNSKIYKKSIKRKWNDPRICQMCGKKSSAVKNYGSKFDSPVTKLRTCYGCLVTYAFNKRCQCGSHFIVVDKDSYIHRCPTLCWANDKFPGTNILIRSSKSPVALVGMCSKYFTRTPDHCNPCSQEIYLTTSNYNECIKSLNVYEKEKRAANNHGKFRRKKYDSTHSTDGWHACSSSGHFYIESVWKIKILEGPKNDKKISKARFFCDLCTGYAWRFFREFDCKKEGAKGILISRAYFNPLMVDHMIDYQEMETYDIIQSKHMWWEAHVIKTLENEETLKKSFCVKEAKERVDKIKESLK